MGRLTNLLPAAPGLNGWAQRTRFQNLSVLTATAAAEPVGAAGVAPA
jgi:hypothetical protein